MAALVLEYYLLLRSVLRAKPDLRRLLTRCRHCRIFFLAHPRNANRRHTLRCPFGCQQAHRRRESIRRSVAHNRGEEGKAKKRDLNNKRNGARARKDRHQVPAAAVPGPGTGSVGPGCPTALPDPATGPLEPACRAGGWNEPMVEHVRMVSSLIEGRRVSRREVLEMLAKVLRQHSIGRSKRIDHTVAWLNEHPP